MHRLAALPAVLVALALPAAARERRLPAQRQRRPRVRRRRRHLDELTLADVACNDGLDFATTDPVANPNVVPTTPGTDVVNSCEATDAPVWRNLRAIELHVKHAGFTVGGISIRPRAGRVTADGAVKVVRSRRTREGRTVIARMAVRLDDRLAGERLALEVEATDRRGRRQLERG
jgi:hypothetical protein